MIFLKKQGKNLDIFSGLDHKVDKNKNRQGHRQGRKKNQNRLGPKKDQTIYIKYT
jgi:hypothetical protein